MYCIKCFNMQVFIYKKNSEKKILYTNMATANLKKSEEFVDLKFFKI